MLHIDIFSKTLTFRRPAGTSRGTYTTRQVRYVVATDTNRPWHVGIGECAPLPKLSCDDLPDYDQILARLCRQTEADGHLTPMAFANYPSMLFGMETALQQLAGDSAILWPTTFTDGTMTLPTNGLIWMGTFEDMRSQLDEKMADGYQCIKLKIGAIDFLRETELLRRARKQAAADTLTLRVDANGAFTPQNAMDKLNRLAQFDIHSIEQPIRAGQWSAMAKLCRESPVDIALDEELIGINDTAQKARMLDTIKPKYIVLKPSLHGGIFGCDEWIRLAEERGIGWWATSALESNIGLNAIAQWTATKQPATAQGLGTGQLFTDNVPMPLSIANGQMHFDPTAMPDMTQVVKWIKQ